MDHEEVWRGFVHFEVSESPIKLSRLHFNHIFTRHWPMFLPVCQCRLEDLINVGEASV